MVLGFDLEVLGLKKRVLGFEKRVLGFEKKRNSPKAEKQKSPKNPLRNYKTFMKSTQIANVQIKKSTMDAYLSLTCLHGV